MVVSDNAESRAAELERLGRDWAAAELRGDAAFLEGVLAEDFVGVGPRGFMLTREGWLERHRSGKLRYESFHLDEVRVRLYGGDAAVMTAREVAEGRYADGEVRHDLRECFRATLVFAEQREGWQLASVHLSPMGEGS